MNKKKGIHAPFGVNAFVRNVCSESRRPFAPLNAKNIITSAVVPQSGVSCFLIKLMYYQYVGYRLIHIPLESN